MKGWSTNEKLNYDDVSIDAPKPPPEGLYRARAAEAKPQPTSKGKPMIKVVCALYETEDGTSFKRKVNDYVVLSQDTAHQVKRLAAVLDIEPLEENNYEAAEAFCAEVIRAGKDGFWVQVRHDTFTKKGGDPENPDDQITTAKIGRYLTEAEVAKSKDKSKANGAATEGAPARRPRNTATAAVS